jgi:hypothetical protein
MGLTAPQWDDATREMPVAGRKPDPLPPPELHSPRVRQLIFGGLVLAVLIAGALIIGSIDRGDPAPPRRAESAIDLVGGTEVTVRSADLGTELYRAKPSGRVTDDAGRIRIEVGSGPVELLLADRVAWALTIGGPADRRTLDLGRARLSTLAVNDSATRLDLRLPRPEGTLAVRVTGGINQFALHTSEGVPVRVRVGSGAGQVVLAGEQHNGVAAGALFTPDGWSGAGDRVDLDAAAGMAQLRVTAGEPG